MTRDDIMNQVLIDMYTELTNEQLSDLKNSLTKVLYSVEIISKITDLVTCDDDNYKLLSKFEAILTIEQKSPKTIYHYKNSTKKFLTFTNKNFRDISTDDINYYFAYLMTKKDGKKLSGTSLDNERKFIKGFFNWLYDNEYITRNPFNKINPIRRNEIKKEILTGLDIDAIKESCITKRDIALIDFLSVTGVRVSECSQLKINDVNFRTGDVMIYSNKTKTHRTVFLDEVTLKHLTEYISCRNNISKYVFTNNNGICRLNAQSINNIIGKITSRSNIHKHITCHSFRKTLASKLFRRKIMSVEEISTMLGHSPSTCVKFYISIDSNDIKNNYQRSTN